MDAYTCALYEAADNLFRSLGALNDLGPELADTVANVYYRYALATGTVDDLAFALGMPNDLTTEIEIIVAQQEYIDEMIKALRRTGREGHVVERMKLIILDTFKYRIENAAQKTALRRAIERRLANFNEIAGLYQRVRDLVTEPEEYTGGASRPMGSVSVAVRANAAMG
jgi:hypothetical protein